MVLLPPLFLLGILCLFRGKNVVWGDDVSMCPIFDKFYHSRLAFHDLWEPYQGHRVLFHRSLELFLGWATHWNTSVNIGFVYATFLADFFLLCWLLQDLRPTLSERTRLILMAVISLSIFSANQVENWANGWQMGLALCTLCSLGGLVLLAKRGAGFGPLAWCLLAGIVASYSFGNGLVYWVALVPLLGSKLRGDPWRWAKGILWAATAGVVIFFYFHAFGGGAVALPPGGAAPNIPQRVGTFFHYLLTCSGAGIFFLNGAKAHLSPAAHRVVAAGAPLCGLIGLTALAVVVWRLLKRGERLPEAAPWFAMGLYGLGSVGVTCLARYTTPPESAIASRYITYSQYLWLSLFVLLALLAPRMHRRWRQGPGIVLALCYLVSYANGVRLDQGNTATLKQIRAGLLSQPTPETYHLINPDRDPAQVASFMEMTRENRLALFHDAPVPKSP